MDHPAAHSLVEASDSWRDGGRTRDVEGLDRRQEGEREQCAQSRPQPANHGASRMYVSLARSVSQLSPGVRPTETSQSLGQGDQRVVGESSRDVPRGPVRVISWRTTSDRRGQSIKGVESAQSTTAKEVLSQRHCADERIQTGRWTRNGVSTASSHYRIENARTWNVVYVFKAGGRGRRRHG